MQRGLRIALGIALATWNSSINNAFAIERSREKRRALNIAGDNIDNERERQNLICLDEVKIYGNKSKKLFLKIIKNNEIKTIKLD
jgi:hypothetical protein